MGAKTILIVEDEMDISEPLRFSLSKNGYQVSVVEDGLEALDVIRKRRPNMILLDLMIPGMNGIELCKKLRADTLCREIPVIMLTAKDDETDVLLGLGVGADDYVTKPFSTAQLVARIKAVLTRGEWVAEGDEEGVCQFGAFRIDRERHQAWVKGDEVELTATEFRLLFFLASHSDEVFERDDLINATIGEYAVVIDRNIDVHIRSIRKKIGFPGIIQTVRGVGYRFDPTECPSF